MYNASIPLHPESSPATMETAQYLEAENWLSFHHVWGKMSDATISAIAQHLQFLPILANVSIYRENQIPQGLYFLKWGTVETYRNSAIGKHHITDHKAGEVFGYLPLVTNELDHAYQANAVTLTPSEVWFLDRDTFQALTQAHPDFQQEITSLLVQDLEQFTQRIATEQARIQGLQPYLSPLPDTEKIVGLSKASEKLKQAVIKASEDQNPVVMQAQQGTGKTFISSLIHQQSALKDQPFAEIDCAFLPREENGKLNSDRVFGNGEAVIGIFELLERGTLAIDNVHLLSHPERDRIYEYLQTGIIYLNVTRRPPYPPLHPPQWGGKRGGVDGGAGNWFSRIPRYSNARSLTGEEVNKHSVSFYVCRAKNNPFVVQRISRLFNDYLCLSSLNIRGKCCLLSASSHHRIRKNITCVSADIWLQ